MTKHTSSDLSAFHFSAVGAGQECDLSKGLSVRRAQAVAGELVRDGVPQSAITIQGFGDTHLLVATGPGVREPQNRRVEIIIK